ncbi:MAG: VCBS domain-containing protein, partial [Rhizobiaceae bacterium]|nr:VCBS domain-containing protein [Rhizobiaceae bacterium]
MSRNERFNNKKNAESRDCEDHDSHRRDQATNGNDTLIGTGHSDSILGRRGDDHIKGKGGNDLLFGQNGNDTINGGAGRDLLDGGNGSDTLRGGSGNDVLLGGAGADTLRGGTGNDLLFGGQGDDILRGGVGHDFLSGGTGNDILRGGADSDVVDGGRGDDSLIYAVADNLGASDTYSGGKGNDTLVLKLTSAEWFDPQVQADIASFLDFLEPDCERHGGRRHHSGHGGEALGQFHFTTFDLTVSQIENLRVFVDGTEVSLQDDFIIANPDAATLSEDASATEFSSVLDNDAGSDLAYSVQLVDGPVAGNLTFNAGEPGTPDGSFSFDPAGAFEHLAEGESEDVSFTYEVQDASGNTAQSTVTVTVTGTNDVPVITSSAQSGAVAEDGTLTATGQVTASDADNGAVLAFSGDATGSHGGFAINAGTGAWTYTLDNGAAQSLAEG